MADKAHVEQLGANIQQAVAAYDPNDKTSWMRIQTALEQMRRAIEPPEFFLMGQRFHVCLNHSICVTLGRLTHP